MNGQDNFWILPLKYKSAGSKCWMCQMTHNGTTHFCFYFLLKCAIKLYYKKKYLLLSCVLGWAAVNLK